MILVLRIVGFLFLISTATCRSVITSDSASPDVAVADKSETNGTAMLKKVLQFYRTDINRRDIADSTEFESNEAAVTKAPSYRLDFIEVGDENEESLKDVDVTEDVEVEKSIVENKDVQKDITEDVEVSTPGNPEEAEVETTTLFPMTDVLNNHSSKSDFSSDDSEDVYEKDCVEGEVTTVKCNTCVCSDGNYYCSKKMCVEPTMPPKYRVPSMKNKKKRPGVYMNITEPVFENYFFGDGDDPPSSTTPIPQCVDGRTKPVDCNQCICALGKWACTKMSCIALTLREKASFSGAEFIQRVDTLKENPDIDDDCMVGDTKQFGCNQCVCHQNSWACTDLMCPATSPSPKLPDFEEACQTEEDVKSKECNICACRRGIWVCTKNDCKKFGNRHYHPSIRTSPPKPLLEIPN